VKNIVWYVNCYTYTFLRKSKSYVETRCFTVNTHHSPFAVGKTMQTFRSDMSTYVKICTRTRPRKSKWWRVVLCLFSENLHVVTSRSWYNFVETRRFGWTNGKLCSKLHSHGLVCQKMHTDEHVFLQWTRLMVHSRPPKQWEISTNMPKVAHGHVLISRKNGADMYKGHKKGSNTLQRQMALMWSLPWISICRVGFGYTQYVVRSTNSLHLQIRSDRPIED